jgi:hypothetical protein
VKGCLACALESDQTVNGSARCAPERPLAPSSTNKAGRSSPGSPRGAIPGRESHGSNACPICPCPICPREAGWRRGPDNRPRSATQTERRKSYRPDGVMGFVDTSLISASPSSARVQASDASIAGFEHRKNHECTDRRLEPGRERLSATAGKWLPIHCRACGGVGDARERSLSLLFAPRPLIPTLGLEPTPSCEDRILSPARLPQLWYWKHVAVMMKRLRFKAITIPPRSMHVVVALG